MEFGIILFVVALLGIIFGEIIKNIAADLSLSVLKFIDRNGKIFDGVEERLKQEGDLVALAELKKFRNKENK